MMPPRTASTEQRANDRTAEMDHIFKFMREIRRDIEALNLALVNHMHNEERGMESIRIELEALRAVHTAFPEAADGKPDLRGHRDYHQSRIDAAEQSKEDRKAIRKAAVENGVKVAFAVIQAAVLAYVAIKIGAP